ncbi:hypothetical protein ATZ33_10500 [Enterococcus silesiacus]|uniref:Uncharacterized protein n=2 Tax=Enterococcus silesiacus TaxID=332949 RepID=A0ABM5W957_9ENTE|nr:hypothetical protein [Enterococcus silesiacus]ALS01788.1 hypothetical protein ATZ33_10500 [Enterococcus silesiacus]
MEIKIDRQSVCMGDDVTSHKSTHKISEHTTFLELFLELIEKNYFPHIQGNNVVWVLRFDGKDRIAWKTKENNFHECNMTRCSINSKVKRIPMVTFIYYPSLKEWEEKYEDYQENKTVQINWLNKLKNYFLK